VKVVVYVEGASDREAMDALLKPLIEQKQKEGIGISFPAPARSRETGKSYLLIKVPRKAAIILSEEPSTIVVTIPDLYPKNEAFPHETVEELEAGILRNFNAALHNIDNERKIQLEARFKVFCFKHDLEALILASEEGLRRQLGLSHLEATWQKPVEDLDQETPPKQIVERLFKENGRRYRSIIHARAIMEKSDYQEIARRCPQCFKPFVDFLTDLQPTGYSDQHD